MGRALSADGVQPAIQRSERQSGPPWPLRRRRWARPCGVHSRAQRRMAEPLQQAFRRGDRTTGIATFIDSVFNDPQGGDKMAESSRKATLRDGHEWDVMMSSGHLIPRVVAQDDATYRGTSAVAFWGQVAPVSCLGSRRMGAPASAPPKHRASRCRPPNVVPGSGGIEGGGRSVSCPCWHSRRLRRRCPLGLGG
jgi:hypothetical protein